MNEEKKVRLSRRDVMTSAAKSGGLMVAGALLGTGTAFAAGKSESAKPIIRTVTHDMLPADLGITLIHEHLSIDLGPNGSMDTTWTRDIDLMISEVTMAGLSGISCIVDSGTSDLLRRIEDLKRISTESRVHIIASTGLWVERWYPDEIKRMSEDAIADDFVREIRQIRSGVIGEIGSSGSADEPITPLEKKVFRAAGKAHVRTGLPVHTHTANGLGAIEQLDILESVGVKPESIAIGHLDCTLDTKLHAEVARRGAFVTFDRIGLENLHDWPTDLARAEMVIKLLEAGYEDRLLFSADTARHWRLVKNGGKGYAETLTHFVPRLLKMGVSERTLMKIMADNPRRFLSFVPKV